MIAIKLPSRFFFFHNCDKHKTSGTNFNCTQMSIIFTPHHGSWFLTRRTDILLAKPTFTARPRSLHQGDERKQEEPTLSAPPHDSTWSHAAWPSAREGNNKHLLNTYTWSWGTWCRAGTLAIPFRSLFFANPLPGFFLSDSTDAAAAVEPSGGRQEWQGFYEAGIWHDTPERGGGNFQQSHPRTKLETMLNGVVVQF